MKTISLLENNLLLLRLFLSRCLWWIEWNWPKR